MIYKTCAFLFGLILVCAMFIPAAKADEWDQMTKLTFSAPVEIPGHVLPAGTYWFILEDSPSNRNIVEVFNQDWSRQLAMFIAIPTYRQKPTGDTEIRFAERPHDRPEAMLKWYYPGLTNGQQFIYSHRHESEFSRDSKRDVKAPPLGMASVGAFSGQP
jgi:hypothetical protein